VELSPRDWGVRETVCNVSRTVLLAKRSENGRVAWNRSFGYLERIRQDASTRNLKP